MATYTDADIATQTRPTRYADIQSGRAFSGSSQWGYRARVDPDGTVRVYDETAHHYTVCHALTPRQIAHVQRVAEAVR